MTDEIYISELQAMRVLMHDGDFSESQTRIVLGHSLKQAYDGGNYYPSSYIHKRARDNAARDNAARRQED